MTLPFSTLHRHRHLALLLVLGISACSTDSEHIYPDPCSEEWQRWVESRVTTGDGHGHGPDIGSDEWRSVVEFKLGIRGDPSIPSRNSSAWCEFIDHKIRTSHQ